jgi:hypothetical protein
MPQAGALRRRNLFSEFRRPEVEIKVSSKASLLGSWMVVSLAASPHGCFFVCITLISLYVFKFSFLIRTSFGLDWAYPNGFPLTHSFLQIHSEDLGLRA